MTFIRSRLPFDLFTFQTRSRSKEREMEMDFQDIECIYQGMLFFYDFKINLHNYG